MKTVARLDGVWDFNHKGHKTKIKVPLNWYLGGHDIYGEAEYSRDFKLKKLKGRKYYINFDGVDYFADVFINGKKAGSHEGYFQKFDFDVTKLLKNGANKISVKVNSPKEEGGVWPDKKFLIKGIFNHHDARPGSWDKTHGQDRNTGGIWNSVYVTEAAAVEIERVKITPFLKPDGVWNVSMELSYINNSDKEEEALLGTEMEPKNFKGKSEKLTRRFTLEKGKGTFTVYHDVVNPALWWTWDLGKPNLYDFSFTLKTVSGSDSLKETSGIRQLTKEGINWYLNGKRLFLRGTNMIPTQFLSEYTPELIMKDIKMMREANLNMMRIHAHVNREELYAGFDAAGIMVWQDFALIWGYETTDKFMENAARQIKEMIDMHYNRPSITVWCCHNEPFVNEKQLDPVLYNAARSADPVRYIDTASDFKQHHYQGWYYDDNITNSWSTFDAVKKAGIITEYGAQALPCLDTLKKTFKEEELFPMNRGVWEFRDFQCRTNFVIAGLKEGASIEEFIESSQKYQADLIKEQTELFRHKKHEVIGGLLHFMMMECWPSITWAVVDYFRVPKKGYYALKTAMQPLLPCYRLVTKKVAAGEQIGWGSLWPMLTVINDLHQDFKNVSFRVSLRSPDNKRYFTAEKKADIKADCVSSPFETGVVTFEGDNFKVPQGAAAGTHVIEISLADSEGKIIAYNDYEFEVISGLNNACVPGGY